MNDKISHWQQYGNNLANDIYINMFDEDIYMINNEKLLFFLILTEFK